MHLQKRYMNNYAGDVVEFLIVDNAFLPLSMEKDIRDKFENHPEPLDWTGGTSPKQSRLVKMASNIDKVRRIGLKPIFLRFLRWGKGIFKKRENG